MSQNYEKHRKRQNLSSFFYEVQVKNYALWLVIGVISGSFFLWFFSTKHHHHFFWNRLRKTEKDGLKGQKWSYLWQITHVFHQKKAFYDFQKPLMTLLELCFEGLKSGLWPPKSYALTKANRRPKNQIIYNWLVIKQLTNMQKNHVFRPKTWLRTKNKQKRSQKFGNFFTIKRWNST